VTWDEGVSPFALQIKTFQKKERIKGLAMKGKIKRNSLEKVGIKRMPTHNFANRCTRDHK